MNVTRSPVKTKADFVLKFLSKVKKTRTCWVWLGGRSGNYGRIGAKSIGGKRDDYAHRVSWILFRGKIPNGRYVLHKCDNPVCVNPDHLYPGTPQNNVDDMWNRGRARPPKGYVSGAAKSAKEDPETTWGENNGNSKLTEVDVYYIRKHYKSTSYKVSNTRALAKKFGVTPNLIRHVVSGKRWSHV